MRLPCRRTQIFYPKSQIKHPKSNISHQKSQIQHLTSQIKHPTSKIQHQKSHIQHLTSSFSLHFLQGIPQAFWIVRRQKKYFSAFQRQRYTVFLLLRLVFSEIHGDTFHLLPLDMIGKKTRRQHFVPDFALGYRGFDFYKIEDDGGREEQQRKYNQSGIGDRPGAEEFAHKNLPVDNGTEKQDFK
jgi:hypothetical protein